MSMPDTFCHYVLHSTLPVVTESATECDLCTVILGATQCMKAPPDTEELKKSEQESPELHLGHHIW
jgi:hypothetical protein